MTPSGGEASVLILLGSARSDGDTAGAARALASSLAGKARILDLGTKDIRPFDYEDPAPEDDFAGVVDLMLAHRSFVFATPVYWYSMSAVMKTFFDRLSDLLSPRDPSAKGRQLAGREVWLLAVGTDPALPLGFEAPFEMTARYLKMEWRGGFYVRSGKALDLSAVAALARARGLSPGRVNEKGRPRRTARFERKASP